MNNKHRLLKIFLLFLIVITLNGIIFETICQRIDNNRFKPVGKIIDIDGHNMHVFSKGTGAAAIVFASGWGQPCPYVDFYPLHNELSKSNRIVVYDRPGYGWSDTAENKRDIDIIVDEIHKLLIKSGEKPPYILVGHSIGALEVIRYAQLYKDEVKGIVLIDGSNPDMYSIIKPVSDAARLKLKLFHKFIKSLNILGISRLALSIPGFYSDHIFSAKNKLSLVSEELRQLDKSMFLKTLNNKNQVEEGELKEANAAKIAADKKLEDIALVIFTSQELYEYEDAKKVQDSLKNWSNNSKQIIVKGAKHHIHWYEPNIIIEEIKKMIANIK